jgi:serine/threonine protein kinase
MQGQADWLFLDFLRVSGGTRCAPAQAYPPHLARCQPPRPPPPPPPRTLAPPPHCSLQGCFQWDPELRFTPEQALQHEWLGEPPGRESASPLSGSLSSGSTPGSEGGWGR